MIILLERNELALKLALAALEIVNNDYLRKANYYCLCLSILSDGLGFIVLLAAQHRDHAQHVDQRENLGCTTLSADQNSQE
ncbi:hypothetical protein BG74_06355 [Sodalis-like endosymbiont of Proechinophthirus fluctus]|nr:hypothetical protein BG74_06355 [Sodalis-like endosymbiont of Proechinophthirus fluctus]